MYKLFLLLLIMVTISCKSDVANTEVNSSLSASEELKQLYKADQDDRKAVEKDWKAISKRDDERQARVYELLESNQVETSEDYANAAMIFQHGADTTASTMAVKMMRKAIELDPTRDKWLLAAAIDRDLMRKDQPQIYGTQYRRMSSDEPWARYKIDTTKVTDEERIAHGVETLAEQRIKEKMMNKVKLSDLLTSGKSVDEIIAIIESSDVQDSEYDLSEAGINIFGYQVMGQGKDDEALKIFKLNTELYPEAFNAFDSYGECLVKLGKEAEGLAAYKKSVELNPGHVSGKKIIAEIESKLK